MPTYDAASRDDNIVKSIYAYVNSAIVSGLGIRVYFMGQERVGLLPPQWIEADFIYPNQVGRIDHTPGGGRGAFNECHLNMNCFMSQESGLGATGIFAIITLETNVKQLFQVPLSIPIRDYNTSGHPIVGSLRVDEEPTSRSIPTANGSNISQVNISVCMRYHAATTG